MKKHIIFLAKAFCAAIAVSLCAVGAFLFFCFIWLPKEALDELIFRVGRLFKKPAAPVSRPLDPEEEKAVRAALLTGDPRLAYPTVIFCRGSLPETEEERRKYQESRTFRANMRETWKILVSPVSHFFHLGDKVACTEGDCQTEC